jgi:hypothetical protein
MGTEELKDFEIKEEEKIETAEVIEETVETTEEEIADDKLEKIINFDYSSTDEFDYNTAYEEITTMIKKSDELKSLEAENVIKDFAPKFMEQFDIDKINNLRGNLLNFFRKYSVNNVEDLTEQEKDKIFGIANFMFNNFKREINKIMFTINLTRDELKFISDAFYDKIEYDGKTIHNIIELKEVYLDSWKQLAIEMKGDVKEIGINIDIRNVVMLYHFLSDYKIKGMGKQFYIFKGFLDKMIDANKIFNAYTVFIERLSTDYQLWTGSITPQPVAEITEEGQPDF